MKWYGTEILTWVPEENKKKKYDASIFCKSIKLQTIIRFNDHYIIALLYKEPAG